MNHKKYVFFLLISFFFVLHNTAQSNFNLELFVGVEFPTISNKKINSVLDQDLRGTSIKYTSSMRLHYLINDKKLFFAQLLYSNSGDMEYEVSNIQFPLDVNSETSSNTTSSFDMSYIGLGLGSSYSVNFNVFIDVNLNYIRHIDNTFNDVFYSGWDQVSSPSNGNFRGSNLLGSLGIGYRIGKVSARIGYEKFFGKYQIDSLFGEFYSRSDFSFRVGYNI